MTYCLTLGCVLWWIYMWPHCRFSYKHVAKVELNKWHDLVISCTVNYMTHLCLSQMCVCLTYACGISNHIILALCVFALFLCLVLREDLGHAHKQWLTVFCRLGRHHGLRDCSERWKCSATTTMHCDPASCPEGERAAPFLTIPGAVKGKVGPAGFAGLGNICSQVNVHSVAMCKTLWSCIITFYHSVICLMLQNNRGRKTR